MVQYLGPGHHFSEMQSEQGICNVAATGLVSQPLLPLSTSRCRSCGLATSGAGICLWVSLLCFLNRGQIAAHIMRSGSMRPRSGINCNLYSTSSRSSFHARTPRRFLYYMSALLIFGLFATAGEKPDAVRTHLRNMLIMPEMIGSVVGVYNGKTFNQVGALYTATQSHELFSWRLHSATVIAVAQTAACTSAPLEMFEICPGMHCVTPNDGVHGRVCLPCLISWCCSHVLQVEIKPDMIGSYLAEYSISYKPVKHGKPGIGATHSSRFIPLK